VADSAAGSVGTSLANIAAYNYHVAPQGNKSPNNKTSSMKRKAS